MISTTLRDTAEAIRREAREAPGLYGPAAQGIENLAAYLDQHAETMADFERQAAAPPRELIR